MKDKGFAQEASSGSLMVEGFGLITSDHQDVFLPRCGLQIYSLQPDEQRAAYSHDSQSLWVDLNEFGWYLIWTSL